MKKIYCTLLIFVPFLLNGPTMAQGLKFGVGGGLSFFSEGGNTPMSYNAGYHVGGKLKLDIPLVPITPVAFVNYHFISGTLPFSYLTNGAGSGNVDYKQKLLSYGVGAEYTLLPGLVKPYIAVDFCVNTMGDATFNTPISSYTETGKGSRTGLDVGAGVELKIPFLFTIDGSVKYNMMNLFRKDSGENSFNAVVANVSVLF